ncbi:zinc finger protein 415-like [Drosophila santomea]|uniref:zinc finger protein 415-like n=1 Tax=Drosophila santomea TaxID=129105 RepID=UPI0019543584|nr:zinc finger protein 415-like [Drosophila santomea]
MEKICRVCLANHDELVNIFHGKTGLGLSIPEMIAKWSGYRVSKGDYLPEHICPSCLEDAQHACKFQKSLKTPKSEPPDLVEIDQSTEKVQEFEICVGDLYQTHCHSQRTKDAFGDHHYSASLVLPRNTWKFDDRDRSHCLSRETPNQDAQTVISTPVDKRNTRLGTREKTHKCCYCPKAFRVKYDLTKHIRTHTGERPFQCSHCQWSFKQKYHLRRHMLVHTAVGPYKCSTCERAFKSLNLLLTHNLIHYSEVLEN